MASYNKNGQVNIYDIAQMANVSIATVSRVVNGSDKVSENTRKRVLEIIEKVGFTPNVFARGLGLNTMHTVGITVPTISDMYMARAVYYLEKFLSENGYNCILGCSGFEQDGKKAQVDLLLSKRIDALILVGSTYAGSGENIHDTDYIREAAKNVPVFVINGDVTGENVYACVCDDKTAMYEVTSALIKNGRKKIMFISDSHSYSDNKKLEGYETALKEAKIPVRGELKMYVQNEIHYVRDMLLQYKNLSFDAVVATDDAIAVGALKYAAAKGLSVPGDISVAGYNNSSMAIASEPELTSVDNHVEQVCFDTVERLLKVIHDEAKEVKPRVMVPCHIVKRNTTDF